MPFCSHRCRRIDLERWLEERCGLPYERPEEPEDSQIGGSESNEGG